MRGRPFFGAFSWPEPSRLNRHRQLERRCIEVRGAQHASLARPDANEAEGERDCRGLRPLVVAAADGQVGEFDDLGFAEGVEVLAALWRLDAEVRVGLPLSCLRPAPAGPLLATHRVSRRTGPQPRRTIRSRPRRGIDRCSRRTTCERARGPPAATANRQSHEANPSLLGDEKLRTKRPDRSPLNTPDAHALRAGPQP
jgi:hypothetical protein